MLILGIESSCDDTSIALLEVKDGIFTILKEHTASQIDIHKKYGGVIPEVAGRKHAEAILPVIEEVLNGTKPDVIASTTGPGLITGLLVGTEVGRTLSYLWDVPFVSTNHIEGHIHSVILESEKNIEFPAIALIVSGGHTELILMRDHGEYELLGKTVDDAAGEAFDKVAKLLELEYPGGPKISKFAESGNAKAISFPRPMLDKNNLNFSFSGLKTAALYWLRDNELGKDISIEDFCASFETAIVEVLVKKTQKAIAKHNPKTIILGGGVSANRKLRKDLEKSINIPLLYPNSKYCMDNGAMIAVAGYYKATKKDFTDWKDIKANPNWKVYE